MFVIWLTFEKEDEDYLEKIINKLSKKYNSILFKPHITIWGLTKIELNKIIKTCKNIAIEIQSFNVEFLNISHSKKFWKTVFVNLKIKNQFKISSISILKYSNKIENWEIVKKINLK